MTDISTYQQLLDKIIPSIKSAAEILKKPINHISDGANPTTDIDRQMSDYISECLSQAHNIPILSEEAIITLPANDQSCWIIDPIDGTMNFISGSPDIAISIALVDQTFSAQLAVVYLPLYDQLYTAIKGAGAQLNGSRLQKTATQLNTIALNLPANADERQQHIAATIKALVSNAYVLRQSGSAVLDICRVGLGMWRSYWQNGLFIWDVVAADLIAREAGCYSMLNKVNNNYEYNYLLAASNAQLSQLQAIISI